MKVYDCSLYYSATFLCWNSLKIKSFLKVAFGLKIQNKRFKGKV